MPRLVTLPPATVNADPLLLRWAPGLTVITPALVRSVVVSVPERAIDPLAVTLPPFQPTAWPAATVSGPPSVMFVSEAGPVAVKVVVVNVVTPLRAALPVRTY